MSSSRSGRTGVPKSPLSPSTLDNITQKINSYASSTTETYVAYGLTKKLFDICSKQADYNIPSVLERRNSKEPVRTKFGEDLGVGGGWWYDELGLLPTFSTWSQVTFLHMYLIIIRLRALPTVESYQTYSRHLFDHFSHQAEQRMVVLHNINMRGIRNNYLKDLFIQWRGILAAYDEGMIIGDAVLGTAVWRNIWKASFDGTNGDDMEWTGITLVVAYMRRVAEEFANLDEADLLSAIESGSHIHLENKRRQEAVFGVNHRDKTLVTNGIDRTELNTRIQ